jgi:methylase of polypeptide subunit release factors
VYAGPDSWILFTHVWRFGLGGERALELGTGTGLVANLLTDRYRSVIATDITDDAVATAALSRQLLKPEIRDRLSVVRADVGDSLHPESFDLVTANAPWVPSSAAHGNVFADGGPSGSELPLRFLTDGIQLLRPTGTLVLMCADLRFDDGRAPVGDALSRLRADGFTTEVIATPKETPFTFEDETETNALTGLRSARHVTVVVYRQSQLRARDEPRD